MGEWVEFTQFRSLWRRSRHPITQLIQTKLYNTRKTEYNWLWPMFHSLGVTRLQSSLTRCISCSHSRSSTSGRRTGCAVASSWYFSTLRLNTESMISWTDITDAWNSSNNFHSPRTYVQVGTFQLTENGDHKPSQHLHVSRFPWHAVYGHGLLRISAKSWIIHNYNAKLW